MDIWLKLSWTIVWVIVIIIGKFILDSIITGKMFKRITGVSRKIANQYMKTEEINKSTLKVNLIADIFKKISLLALVIVCGVKIFEIWGHGDNTTSQLFTFGGIGGAMAIGGLFYYSEDFQALLAFFMSQVIDEGDYVKFKNSHWEEQFIKAHSVYMLEFRTKHNTRHFMAIKDFMVSEFEVIPDIHDRVVEIPIFPNTDVDLIDTIFQKSIKDNTGALLPGILENPYIRTELDPATGTIRKFFLFGVNGVKQGWKLEPIILEKIIKLMTNSGISIGTPTGIWRDTQMDLLPNGYPVGSIHAKNPVPEKVETPAAQQKKSIPKRISTAVQETKQKVTDRIDLYRKKDLIVDQSEGVNGVGPKQDNFTPAGDVSKTLNGEGEDNGAG